MSMMLTGQWKEAIKTTATMARNAKAASDKAVRDEAMLFVRAVDNAFKIQGAKKRWTPISVITRELRRRGGKVEGGSSFRGTKPLIRSGSLRRSVTWKKAGEGKYFVGVHRTAESSDGKHLTNIAAVHETGLAIIPVTDKMRRYFMWLFLQGVLTKPWPPKDKAFIVIRQRSFLSDTMDVFRKGMGERIYARWVNYMMAKKVAKKGK